MNKDEKIYVAGHKGLVGSSVIRKLKLLGYNNIVFDEKKYLDLRDQTQVKTFFWEEKPDYVFLAAAKVGGINWNKTNPAEFIYDNLMIQSNIINECHLHDVKKINVFRFGLYLSKSYANANQRRVSFNSTVGTNK